MKMKLLANSTSNTGMTLQYGILISLIINTCNSFTLYYFNYKNLISTAKE